MKIPPGGAATLCATHSIAPASCDFIFGYNEPEPAGKNINGDRTFHHIADNSMHQKNGIGLLAVSLPAKDSAALKIDFNNDSSYHIYQLPAHTIDSDKYYPDNSFKTLFIVSDSITYPLAIQNYSDS